MARMILVVVVLVAAFAFCWTDPDATSRLWMLGIGLCLACGIAISPIFLRMLGDLAMVIGYHDD